MTKNTKIQKAKQSTTDNERLLAAEAQIQVLCEQIESWREQVENLNLELRKKEQQLQDSQEELNYINNELSSALILQSISLDEAEELKKIILKSNNSVIKYLAESLIAIYSDRVRQRKLELLDNSSTVQKPLKNAANNKVINNLKQFNVCATDLYETYNQIHFQLVMLRANVRKFKDKRAEIIAASRKKNVNTNHYISPPQVLTLL